MFSGHDAMHILVISRFPPLVSGCDLKPPILINQEGTDLLPTQPNYYPYCLAYAPLLIHRSPRLFASIHLYTFFVCVSISNLFIEFGFSNVTLITKNTLKVFVCIQNIFQSKDPHLLHSHLYSTLTHLNLP